MCRSYVGCSRVTLHVPTLSFKARVIYTSTVVIPVRYGVASRAMELLGRSTLKAVTAQFDASLATFSQRFLKDAKQFSIDAGSPMHKESSATSQAISAN